MKNISQRVQNTQSPPLVELGKMATEKSGCISFGQGAPFYFPTKQYFSPLIDIIDLPAIHRYTPDPGLISLREKLTEKLKKDNSIETKPDNIVITPGANQAFFNILLTITDPGDEIILLTPYYFNHYMACTSINVIPKQVKLNEDFSIPFDKITNTITDKTQAIVLVNPGNPTGAVHSRADIIQLRELIREHDIYLIADETYEYFVYEGSEHHPVAADQDPNSNIITISSFSKTYGIPGWRLGYYCGPSDLIQASIKVQDTIGICAPHPSQQLALHLLDKRYEIINKFVKLMEDNYNIAIDLVEEISWLASLPSYGAYYLFPKQTTGRNTEKLARDLILDSAIYIVPGTGFGKGWSDHFRISYANVSPEGLKEGFRRLKHHSFKSEANL